MSLICKNELIMYPANARIIFTNLRQKATYRRKREEGDKIFHCLLPFLLSNLSIPNIVFCPTMAYFRIQMLRIR